MTRLSMFGFNRKDKVPAEPEEASATEGGFFSRLRTGLSRTGSQITQGLTEMVTLRRVIDETFLEEIETRLLTADVGVEATTRIVDALRRAVSRAEASDAESLFARLEAEMLRILAPCERPLLLPMG